MLENQFDLDTFSVRYLEEGVLGYPSTLLIGAWTRP